MNAQDLKNSILQLAIQGKLVEQRQEEGTAKELLEQIRAEKERLIKEGKIKKDKPLPAITEEEIPFEIPESWEWVRLGEISENIHYGYTASARDTGDCKLLRITDIQNDCVNWESVPYCNVKDKDYLSYGLNNRDIMIARTGGTIGKTYIIDSLNDRAVFASYLIRVIPVDSINERFIKRYMESPLYWNQLIAGSMGTGQPNVNGTTLSKLLVPLPPLGEQKRIVAKIEELTPHIEKYDESHLELEELNKRFPEDMQKSILQYAIQGKLVEQRVEEGTAEELYQKIQEEKERLIKDGKIKREKPLSEITEDEIPFEIPESWKWVRLGDLFHINPRNSLEDWVEVSFIPMTLLDEGYKNKFSFETKKWGEVKKGFTHFKDNDVVMAKITPCFQNLKSAIMKDLCSGYGAGTTELHVFRIYSEFCLEYLLWFIKGPKFVSDCVGKMSGTAGQQRIGKAPISEYLFPLPPLDEQKRIVVKIEELLSYYKRLKGNVLL